MTDEEKAIIHETVRAYVETSEHTCRFDISPDIHRAHHDAVDKFTATMDKIATLKWGVAKGVLQALVVASLFGLMVFMWQHGIEDIKK